LESIEPPPTGTNNLKANEMAEFHRKIELQTPDDLQYLVSNIRRAANEKIDKDWPPIEEEDTMRKRVEELVHDVGTSSSIPKLLIADINNRMQANGGYF
jgi:hypothetical protein